MRYVLFVCTNNAGRSQIAQAFFERLAPHDLRAESAGQEPADAIWPNVVEARSGTSPTPPAGRSRRCPRHRARRRDPRRPPATARAAAALARPRVGGHEDTGGDPRLCRSVLADYDDVPVGSFVPTIAGRRIRECLRAEECARSPDPRPSGGAARDPGVAG